MLQVDALEKTWDQRSGSSPLRRRMEIVEAGLTLGAGTLLAKASRGAELDLEGKEQRILALLSVAHRRSVPVSVIGNIRKAASCWSRGEKALAHIHLSHARLPAFDDAEQSFRLFAADELLQAGFSPKALMQALSLDSTPLDAFKTYDPDQPRMPAGSGRASGQWTSDGGGVPAESLWSHGQVLSDISADERGDAVAQEDKKEGKDEAEDQLYEWRRMLGEESPKRDFEAGRPIEPGPTLMPTFGGGKSVLVGNNAKANSRGYMTDLPGGLTEARTLFEQMTRGQTVTTDVSDRGVTRMSAPDGTMLRINADSGVRIERPIEIEDKTREVIHFKSK